MKIQVTQDDIAYGYPHDPSSCPISLAVQRIIGPDKNCLVFTNEESSDAVINVLDKYGAITEYTLPVRAYNFILDFDNDQGVQPFEFEFDYENTSNTERYK